MSREDTIQASKDTRPGIWLSHDEVAAMDIEESRYDIVTDPLARLATLAELAELSQTFIDWDISS
jgi:hypothetical protein